MKWFFALVTALMLSGVYKLPAQSADDQYLRIYGLIQDANALVEQNRQSEALARYVEARTALQRFQNGFPEWSPEVVKFRLDFLGAKIADLSSKVQPATPTLAPPKPQEPEKPQPNPLQSEVDALKQQVQQLESDRSLLKAKLQEALAAQPAAVDPRELAKADDKIKSLQKEVELLNASLADAKSKPAADTDALTKTQRALESANHQLAEEKERSTQLSKEKETLQARLKSAADSRELKALRDENDNLKREMATASKKQPAMKEEAALRRIQELQQESAGLRARLQVFETARVPYSAEELELMRRPATKLASTETPATAPAVTPPAASGTAAAPKPAQELSPEATALLAQARRDFNEGQYAKAEEKFAKALGDEQNNAPALADLATIQMQQNRLADADKTIQRALTVEPQSVHALSVLGQIRFREKRYDDALEALSRAATVDPKDAEIQNWLGVTLSEKGNRAQAETALRKAVQLQPGYALAHNNLAVVYATQDPPLLELARWHYQKAMAAGGSKNPDLEKLLEAKAP